MLRKRDCNIVIGTDSFASNHSLSILDEIRTFSKFPHIPLEEMLAWAQLMALKRCKWMTCLAVFWKKENSGVLFGWVLILPNTCS